MAVVRCDHVVFLSLWFGGMKGTVFGKLRLIWMLVVGKQGTLGELSSVFFFPVKIGMPSVKKIKKSVREKK